MEVSNLSQNIEYASFNRRVIAATIDVIILSLILTPLSSLLDYILYDGKGIIVMLSEFFSAHDNVVSSEDLWKFLIEDNVLLNYCIIQFIMFCIIGSFFIGFWIYYKGKTPGKFITNIRIVDADSYSNPTNRRYILRFLCYVLSTLILCLGFIMCSFTKRRQGLHDMMVGTVVIRDKGNFNHKIN
jgi:uncharacterized RDD family membrane protein YckC